MDYKLNFFLQPCIMKVCNWYSYENNRNTFELLHNAMASLHCAVNEELYDGIKSVFHELILSIPEQLFFENYDQLRELALQIRTRINEVAKGVVENESIQSVVFTPFGHYGRNETLTPPVAALKRIWKEDCPLRVFLSHRVDDKVAVARVSNRLAQLGISAFVAHNDIQPTQEWQQEIENALVSMHAFVALANDNFHENSWTDQEVGYALGRGITPIVVKLGKNDPKGFIGKYQAVSLKWEYVGDRLFPMLSNIPQWKDAFISAVRKCNTYRDGMKLSKEMSRIDSLSSGQIHELIRAANENSYIYNCFGFNGMNYEGPNFMDNLKRWTNCDYRYEDGRFRMAMPPPPLPPPPPTSHRSIMK